MKTLKEIFEKKPELLKEKEVIELTQQFAVQFEKIKNNHWDYYNKITNLAMNSELYVIDGIKNETVIKKILSVPFKN
jgi:hypothetical protein